MSRSDHPAPERRRAPRRTPAVDEPLSQIRLRAGRQLAVVDVSDTGVMAEGEMRLLPGTHVEVHLVTSDGRQLVRSRVVRAFVHQLCATRVLYRGTLAFDRPVHTDIVGYGMPEGDDALIGTRGNAYPDSPDLPVGPS